LTLTKQRKFLVAALELIPSHRDAPKNEAQLATALAQKIGQEETLCTGIVYASIAMLDTLGMLQSDEHGVRLSGQLPLYFTRSLSWFAKTGLPLLDGWRRDTYPLTQALPRDEYFDHAPHVLAAIESRRIKLAIKNGINAEASRDQSAVIVLISDGNHENPSYLHQFDSRADQFQLIGGRMELGETILMAARREIVEELGPAASAPIQPETDFTVKLLLEGKPALVTVENSHTYGALTRYTFYGCTAHFHGPIALGPNDRWIPLTEALSGRTHDGKRVGNIRLLERLAEATP
jgi:8-oxo-dGTP pyrophosphatase MutT (NUDIX family)